MSARAWFVLAAACAVAGCTKIESPPPDSEPPNLPQQELYGATVTFYQDDRLSAVLEAGRIRKFERQSVILLDSGMVMDFYDAAGRHTSKLWADSGRTDEVRKDMVAMGQVIALSDSGERLETTRLMWDNRTRKIRSDVAVKLSTPADTFYGIAFESDENLRNWRIEQIYGKTYREWLRRSRDGTVVPSDTAR